MLGTIVPLITAGFKRQALAGDPSLLALIQDAEAKVGMTEPVKAAYDQYEVYVENAQKGVSLFDRHAETMMRIKAGEIKEYVRLALIDYSPLSESWGLGALPSKFLQNPIIMYGGMAVCFLVLFFFILKAKAR